MSGYLCKCGACGREERTGDNPLRNGWPGCCGYTMTLVETERFIANIDAAMGKQFGALAAIRRATPQEGEAWM